MSGADLTGRELDNIYTSYASYGPEHLGDFIRSIWKEAYVEGHDEGYKLGVVEGFNKFKMESKR